MMDDLISRQAAIYIASGYCHPANIAKELAKLPSAQLYSEAEIQTIQDLEQAQIEKAFELGREEGRKEAQPEQRWIPCSELPSDNREVEVTCEVRRCDGKRYRYTCHASYVHKYTIESTDYCDWEEADEYNENEDKYYALPGWYERVHNWDDYFFIAIADFVTAWRELPEPYREEGEKR